MATRITQLAQIITENTALIEEHLQQTGASPASLDIDAPKTLPTSGPSELSRNRAIAAASELADILKGPAELLRFQWTEYSSLRVLLRLGMPKLVPVDGEVTFAELASRTGLPELDVKRVLRHAMVHHIFHKPRNGVVARTALSRLLAEDEEQFDIASTVCEVLWPAAVETANAVSKWPGSEEPEQSAFSLAVNPGKTMWQTFSENPEMGRRFGVFMGKGTFGVSLAENVEWKGKVVDIGGGHGDVMIAILDQHPEVEMAIVQDLPEVVTAGQQRAPSELAGRLKFQAHDFFTPQPESADIYFLRWIFHNWSNTYSVKILRNLIPVMKPGTKIIVNDYVLPEPNTAPWEVERFVRHADMTMFSLLNATERDVVGWHELFAEADSRFKVTKITVTPPRALAIIEIEWQP